MFDTVLILTDEEADDVVRDADSLSFVPRQELQ
jgi:hypothetical protein